MKRSLITVGFLPGPDWYNRYSLPMSIFIAIKIIILTDTHWLLLLKGFKSFIWIAENWFQWSTSCLKVQQSYCRFQFFHLEAGRCLSLSTLFMFSLWQVEMISVVVAPAARWLRKCVPVVCRDVVAYLLLLLYHWWAGLLVLLCSTLLPHRPAPHSNAKSPMSGCSPGEHIHFTSHTTHSYITHIHHQCHDWLLAEIHEIFRVFSCGL